MISGRRLVRGRCLISRISLIRCRCLINRACLVRGRCLIRGRGLVDDGGLVRSVGGLISLVCCLIGKRLILPIHALVVKRDDSEPKRMCHIGSTPEANQLFSGAKRKILSS